MFDLAREGAEVEGLLQDPVTCEADVAGALERPGLRPRLQEDHLGTVDRVGLHSHVTEGIINSKSSATIKIQICKHYHTTVAVILQVCNA